MLRDDVEAAVRAIRARPGFAALIVACLAIGIGANIAMFSIANVLFLRPPPGVRNADGLMRLYIIRRSGQLQTPDGGGFSYADFADVKNARRAFAGLAGSDHDTYTVGHGADAEAVQGENASADYFRVLGARTVRGRFFTADEDSVRGLRPPTVVLGYDYWQSHFQGRDVVGHTITINDRLTTIIGVAERGFQGAGYSRVDMWLPLIDMDSFMHHDPLRDRFMTLSGSVIARRAPGVTATQAAVAATAALTAGVVTDPNFDQHPQVIARMFSDGGPGGAPHGTLILWLFGAVGFVLAIACANVANLLLARAVQRRRELAVRLSLGIGRRRLARQALIESAILAVSGAAVGLLIAWWCTAVWSIPDLGRHPTPWDPTVLAFALGLALVTAIAFGVAPALVATRTDLSLLLKDGAPSASQRRAPGRSALIALQAALALVVLAGSGLFIRSLQKMYAIDLGIDTDHVVFVNPKLPAGPIDSAAQEAIRARVIERLASLSGVRAVSIEDVPRLRGIMIAHVKRPGPDSIPSEANGKAAYINFVGPSYAEALGTPVVSGRDITAADRAGTLPVMVVSQRMARVYWPGRNAIGQCLLVNSQLNPSCVYVVGVVADAPMNIAEPQTSSYYYLPRAQRSVRFEPTIIVRTTGPARAALQTIRDAVAQAAPEVMYAEAVTVPMRLAGQFAPAQLGALLFTVFGIAALGLTAIGLYGVVAYQVAQRTREVGIRIALGSTALAAVALIARQGAKPVAIGLVAGLAGAFAVTRFLQHLLFNVSPTDGTSFASAAALLGLVAAVACVVPARKAARVDPVVALRAE